MRFVVPSTDTESRYENSPAENLTIGAQSSSDPTVATMGP